MKKLKTITPKLITAICVVVLIFDFARGGNVKQIANEFGGIFHHDTLNNQQKQALADQTALLQKQHMMIRENSALLNNNRQHIQKPKRPLMPELSDGQSIADILLKAHLITNRHNFTVKLTNEELVVNSVKQPEETHQFILKKFMKKTGDTVNVNLCYSNKII